MIHRLRAPFRLHWLPVALINTCTDSCLTLGVEVAPGVSRIGDVEDMEDTAHTLPRSCLITSVIIYHHGHLLITLDGPPRSTTD